VHPNPDFQQRYAFTRAKREDLQRMLLLGG